MSVDVVAVSPAMRRAVEVAERAASAPRTTALLVTGETGTGKDLIARFVHERSGATGQLVTIDCAALPETLLESELFGHERGAFTGATEARTGRLESAQGGTLVLDEVAALSPSAQAKLLRVLDERRFQRLGGSTSIDLDARVVALTNVDLREAIAAGTFRNDLFFRLNVVAIDLPSLRSQPVAIAPLAELFATRFVHLPGEGPRITDDAIEMLNAYPFPGNVRELRNTIEQAAIRSGNECIDAADLPEHVVMFGVAANLRPMTLADVEAQYIRSVLEATYGNKAEASRILGISRKNLYERLRRMGDMPPG